MKNLLPLGDENMKNLEAESIHISCEEKYPAKRPNLAEMMDFGTSSSWTFYTHTTKYDFIY